ncbi:MAG: ribosome biogenesis GTP-binding protein YihA/YsxC [Aestuariivirgaceae bacterium]
MAGSGEDAERIEAGRRLFAKPVSFLMGVAKIEQLPDVFPAEIAIGGRSNAGKSSLINALTGRHNLARASNSPGRTREINYFLAAEGQLAIVDLPGYGYARAQKTAVKSWQRLIRDYLRGRPGLRRVLILIDARHGLKPPDLEALNLLDEAAVNYQIVLTKADKCSAKELEAVRCATLKALTKRPAAHPEVHATSARTGSGIAELRAEVADLVQS